MPRNDAKWNALLADFQALVVERDALAREPVVNIDAQRDHRQRVDVCCDRLKAYIDRLDSGSDDQVPTPDEHATITFADVLRAVRQKRSDAGARRDQREWAVWEQIEFRLFEAVEDVLGVKPV